MLLKKILIIFVIYTFVLSGCATHNTGTSTVGPGFSSSYQDSTQKKPLVKTVKLDVIIPVFDPGLPRDPSDYDDENIWPELRRAEANRFAFKLKEKLENTGLFGAVRVTPDKTATGDLYVLGRINASNGEEVDLDIEVMDICGKKWFTKSFTHEVSEEFHRDQRNNGKDSYDPVFEKIVLKIIDELKYHSLKELEDLHYIADLRFGASLAQEAFMPYMDVKQGKFSLMGKPSDDDPMFQRIKAVRVRDQLFIDRLQDNYAAFSAQMNESYLMWQKQSLVEIKAQRAARNKSIGQAIGGVALIGLAVLAAVLGADSDTIGSSTAGTTGLILGSMAGASLLSSSFKTSEEAAMHRDTINELGQSIDMELSPKVIAFGKETIELTGNAREQFAQWRNFLQKIYSREKTPDIQL